MTIVEEFNRRGTKDLGEAITWGNNFQNILLPGLESMLAKSGSIIPENAERLLEQFPTFPDKQTVLRVALGLNLPADEKENIISGVRQLVEHRQKGTRPQTEEEQTAFSAVVLIMDGETDFPNLREKLIASVGLQDSKRG